MWGLLRRKCETSLHYGEDIPLLLVQLDEVLATIGVVPLSLQLVTLTLVPPFFTFTLGVVLVGCVGLEFFSEIIGSIGSAFGSCSSAGLGSEGYGIVVSENALTAFFGGFGLVIGFIIIVFIFLLILIVIFGASLHIKQLVIFILILLLYLLLRRHFHHLCSSRLFFLGPYFCFSFGSLLSAFPEMLVAFTEFLDVGIVGAQSDAFPVLF